MPGQECWLIEKKLSNGQVGWTRRRDDLVGITTAIAADKFFTEHAAQLELRWLRHQFPTFADGMTITSHSFGVAPLGEQSARAPDYCDTSATFRGYDQVHTRKCWPRFFDEIADGSKRCEVRREDDGTRFEADDILRLQEWDPDFDGGSYTGRDAFVLITHVLRQEAGGPDLGLPSDVAVLSIELIRGVRRWFERGGDE